MWGAQIDIASALLSPLCVGFYGAQRQRGEGTLQVHIANEGTPIADHLWHEFKPEAACLCAKPISKFAMHARLFGLGQWGDRPRQYLFRAGRHPIVSMDLDGVRPVLEESDVNTKF